MKSSATRDNCISPNTPSTSRAGRSSKTFTKLEYAVGSGVNGVTYIVRRGDHLFEAPLSYYARARKWALSPGYEFVDVGFNRPVHAACLACHAGRPMSVKDREGLYRDPPFEELAIGCENCHGPGKLHVEKRLSKMESAEDIDPDHRARR